MMQFELLSQLGLGLTRSAQTRLENFVKVFNIYNSHTNLVSKKDEEHFFVKHIYDSLAINLFLQKYGFEKFKMLDIGTGGGFPAIPISIFYDECDILAIDSIAKKIGFVELAKKELMLEHLVPACRRAEELKYTDKGSFDIAVSRAVAPLRVLLEYSVPYLKIGGYFVAYKSLSADRELEEAQNALATLRAEFVEKIDYKLPGLEGYSRQLVIIKKNDKTPSIFPRKSGAPKKLPL